jgi:hypothetical protein
MLAGPAGVPLLPRLLPLLLLLLLLLLVPVLLCLHPRLGPW